MVTISDKGDRQETTLLSNYLKLNGAEGDRTLGLMTASHALSQLSYSPT